MGTTPHRKDVASTRRHLYRIGAVARMVRMPVNTLRIWERRYRLTTSADSALPHRLYSAQDVQRVALLKQLSDQGHAIGTIARLDSEELGRLAALHVRTLLVAQPVEPSRSASASASPDLTRLLLAAPVERPSPRYRNVVLGDIAKLSSTISCECPQHVADLLTRLSDFERYSAECRQLSQADGELHLYLGRVAGTARSLFEATLESIALHEGLMLSP